MTWLLDYKINQKVERVKFYYTHYKIAKILNLSDKEEQALIEISKALMKIKKDKERRMSDEIQYIIEKLNRCN